MYSVLQYCVQLGRYCMVIVIKCKSRGVIEPIRSINIAEHSEVSKQRRARLQCYASAEHSCSVFYFYLRDTSYIANKWKPCAPRDVRRSNEYSNVINPFPTLITSDVIRVLDASGNDL